MDCHIPYLTTTPASEDKKVSSISNIRLQHYNDVYIKDREAVLHPAKVDDSFYPTTTTPYAMDRGSFGQTSRRCN